MSWLSNDRGDTLDAALSQAAERGVPLLALWTASWCPPCNELQLMVFDDPQFARFHDALVLLHIDGDAPGAQLVGERLGAHAYPTALLLDSQGREKLRAPGGLTAREFARALDLGIDHGDTLTALVGRVQRGECLSETDCELLAFHWWANDDRHASGVDRLALLRRVRDECPRSLADARLRLLVQMLIASARGCDVFDEADELTQELAGALASPAARYSNLYFLLVDLTVLRVLGDTRRATIEQALGRSIDALLSGLSLAPTERLIALSALLSLSLQRGAKPDDELRETIRLAAERADVESVTAQQRQTTINMAGHLLKAAGFVNESVALFEREASCSPHAGYFWPYIAATLHEQGRFDDAIAALRKAWQTTPLGCARHMRGAAYVAKLAEIRPMQRELIEREAMAVLREIAPAPDALTGRNRQAVSNLLKALATTELA